MAKHSTNYQPKVAAKICSAIAEGRSLREICEQPGFPSREAVRQWHARHEDFRRDYDAARLLAVDLLADDLNELADSAGEVVRAATAAGINENAAIQGLRVKIDTKKWLLSKLAPARYGDRTTVAGDPDQPLLPPEATDPRRLALALHAIVAGAVKSEEPPLIDATPARGELPAPEPQRVFDASNGQVVKTLLTGEVGPTDDIRAHAHRHIDHPERVVRLPTHYTTGNRR